MIELAPLLVRTRDGRLVPFEVDRVSKDLFEATEELGTPDAFLARELTEGVVHFLHHEAHGAPLSTHGIAETIVKIVRELGHPQLARAYVDRAFRSPRVPAEVLVRVSVDRSPGEAVQECLREYALQAVYARDLAAAHREGFLTLHGLDTPLEFPGQLLQLPLVDECLDRMVEARTQASYFVALDSPDYAPMFEATRVASVERFARRIEHGLRCTGFQAIVNLNMTQPPAWLVPEAMGPLFSRTAEAETPGFDRFSQSEALRKTFLRSTRIRIDWHLDSLRPGLSPSCIQEALRGQSLSFVLDRPRRARVLGEGLDRAHPALLLAVSLNLPRLAEQSQGNPERFLRQLGTLTRLAFSAATQKREFVRRHRTTHPQLTAGFLLERARLLIAPVGFESSMRHITGHALCEGKLPELARQTVLRLREILREESRTRLIEACLDAMPYFADHDPLEEGTVSGITPWAPGIPLRTQLRTLGVLHGLAEGGSAFLHVPEDCDPAALGDDLAWAQSHTEASRIHLLSPGGRLPAAAGHPSV